VRFRPDNPESASLNEIDRITIDTAGVSREYRIVGSAPVGRGMLKLELEGLSDANAAEALKGGNVMVQASQLPATNEREFYYFEAIGSEVVLTDGTSIGSVAEIFSNGANDVMVVRGGKREILVPVIEDVVKNIDLEARRVVIEPVPGLLEE
jgi:16S rRNA processing protein RimM